jgi:hypothetical protein
MRNRTETNNNILGMDLELPKYVIIDVRGKEGETNTSIKGLV